MFFQCQDSEALAVLVRFAESQGATVTGVRPVNGTFVVRTEGSVFEITNQTDLCPFCSDLDSRRTFWEDISEVHSSCVNLLSVFEDSEPTSTSEPEPTPNQLDTDNLLLAGQLIASFSFDSKRGLVLINRQYGVHPFVIAHYRSGASEWDNGRYFADLDSAMLAWFEACQSEYQRDYC